MISDNKMDDWLQGGPFLEVSFIIPITDPRSVLLPNLIDRLKLSKFRIYFDNEAVENAISSFGNDSAGFAKIHFEMLFPEKRRGDLFIEEIAIGKALQITLSFYGGNEKLDYPGHPALKEEDMQNFSLLLRSLYPVFRFPLGSVAFETGCKDLISLPDKTLPDDSYSPENIDFARLFISIRSKPFIELIYDSKFYPQNKLKFLFSEIGNDGIWVSRKWM